jgi:murein DD-endopeptidase MepM/ murein hydrolase activator NlpD
MPISLGYEMSHRIYFLLIVLLCNIVYSQSIQIIGKAAPGNMLIAEFTDKADAANVKTVLLDNTKIKPDSSGIFIFGFDRDDSGHHFLKVEFNNGHKIDKEIDLTERKYEEQKLNVKQKFVTPPKKELNRIKREGEVIREARSKIGIIDSAFFLPGFIKPVKEGRITSVFGSTRILNGIPKSMHNGIDIAAPKGTAVYAATDGIVRLTGKNFYYSGNLILLDHGQGLSSIYIHLNKILVKKGQRVFKGQLIGEIGTTGRSTGPHLHWGVQWYDRRIDPLSLLGLKY